MPRAVMLFPWKSTNLRVGVTSFKFCRLGSWSKIVFEMRLQALPVSISNLTGTFSTVPSTINLVEAGTLIG